VEIDLQAKTGTVREAIFIYAFLVIGFSQASEMTVFPVVVAIIAQFPL
jgi:hypothetical protein